MSGNPAAPAPRTADAWNAYNTLVEQTREMSEEAASQIVVAADRPARRRDLVDLAYAQNEVAYSLTSGLAALASSDPERKNAALRTMIYALEGQQRFFQAFMVRMLGTDEAADQLASAADRDD